MFKWGNFSGSLLVRSVYLITLPIVLVQIVGIVIFFELHWDLVLKRSAQSIANEIKILELNKNNEEIDMSLSLAAKQRSIHNNYSTFLVLFIMLSGHYSFLVYHKYNWLILCLIAIISALGRHYFNLRGRNINKPSILFTSIVALLLLASVIFIFKT